MLRRLILATCFAFLAHPASADTFTLTDGFLSYYTTGDLGRATIHGDDLLVTGTTFGGGRIGVAADHALDWSGTYGFGGCGTATIRGVTYAGDPSDRCQGGIAVAATFQVSAVPFVPTAAGDLWQTPFSLIGTITGTTAAGAALFAVDVTGEGRMAHDYQVISRDLFLTGTPTLMLEPTPLSGTPEPSTWVLVGTALAGFAFMRRRTQGVHP